jgi:hypothetical protein
MESSRAALCTTLFATLIALQAGTAQAASHWLCSISSEGTRLVCVADREPALDAQTDAAVDAAVTTAVVNGTRFPLDTARLYTIDMWSTPTDPEFVALLARSTICYRSPDCQVSLAPSAWLQALARR